MRMLPYVVYLGLISYLGVESLVAFFGLAPPRQDNYFLEPHPRYGLAHMLRGTVRYEYDGRAVEYSINSAGWRSTHEYVPAGSDDRDIVAVVGDSFINAAQVSDDQTATSILGQELDSRKVRVDNYGMGGIGFPSYWHIIRDEILDRGPSMVILCVYGGNDVRNSSPSMEFQSDVRPHYVWGDGGHLADVWFEYSHFRTFLRRIASYSPLYRMLRFRLLVRKAALKTPQQNMPLDGLVLERPWSPEFREAWGYSKTLLDDMLRLTRERGAGFVLCYIPPMFEAVGREFSSLRQAYGQSGRNGALEQGLLRNELRDWANSRQVLFVDGLSAALALPAARRDALYSAKDIHWTVEGNRFLGKLLSDSIAPSLSTRVASRNGMPMSSNPVLNSQTDNR